MVNQNLNTHLLCLTDWLWAGQSGDQIPMTARFSAPVQTGPGAHPASCTMGTRSFPGVKSGRAVSLTPHHLLVPWLGKCRAIPLLHIWAIWPVQSLSACTRVHFTLPYLLPLTPLKSCTSFNITWLLNSLHLFHIPD